MSLPLCVQCCLSLCVYASALYTVRLMRKFYQPNYLARCECQQFKHFDPFWVLISETANERMYVFCVVILYVEVCMLTIHAFSYVPTSILLHPCTAGESSGFAGCTHGGIHPQKGDNRGSGQGSEVSPTIVSPIDSPVATTL